MWESNLGTTDPEAGNAPWSRPTWVLASNSTWERQCKILNMLYVPIIQQYWITIVQQGMFKRCLHPGTRTCLLGQNDELPAGVHKRELQDIALQCSETHLGHVDY